MFTVSIPVKKSKREKIQFVFSKTMKRLLKEMYVPCENEIIDISGNQDMPTFLRNGGNNPKIWDSWQFC